jgi:calcineurin-like phosphoesterase family protein
MIWFSADWHFGHPGILVHNPHRLNAFECVEEMDAQLIDNINALVEPNDELFFLGDYCWKASKAGHYRERLNVRKLHVCQGNHDSSSLRNHVSNFWDMHCRKFACDGATYKIPMCHYPLLSWRGLHHGGLHLYGHSHGIYEKELEAMHPGRRAMDVGIDNIHRLTGEWRPIRLTEVIDRLVGPAPATYPRDNRLQGPFEKGLKT